MGKHQVRVEQYFAAPKAKVFGWFSDHSRLGKIFPGRFTRIKDATSGKDPNGLGSVRQIRQGLLKFEETIVKFEPASLIEYTVTSGGPVKNHLGRMEFSDTDGGTQLDYTITFESKIPFTGWLIARILSSALCAGMPRAVKDIAG